MRKILVDVNVVLDVLLARTPHVVASTACLAAIESGRVEGFLSAHAVTTIAYLVGRARGKVEAKKVVQDLCALFTIAPVDEAVIQRAQVLALDDFEDAVSVAAAEGAGCEAILTRDAVGFAGSPVQGIEPVLWLALIEEEAQGPPDSEVHERQTPPRPVAKAEGRRHPRVKRPANPERLKRPKRGA